MIGADAGHTVTYLTEIFCRWLMVRAKHFATSDGRRTLQLHDLVAGILSSGQLDFLCDLVQEHGNVDAEYERQQQIELELRLRFSRSRTLAARQSLEPRGSRDLLGGMDADGTSNRSDHNECDFASLDDADFENLIGAVMAHSAGNSTRAGAGQRLSPSSGDMPAPTAADAVMHEVDNNANFTQFNDANGQLEGSSTSVVHDEVKFAPFNENEPEGAHMDIADLPAELSGIFCA